MREALQVGLPWLLSIMTILGAWLNGHMHAWTWRVNLINQVGWFTWTLAMGPKSYGLLPLNFFLTVIYIRNHYKWKRNSAHQSTGEKA